MLNAKHEVINALVELSDDQWKQFVGAFNGELYPPRHLSIAQLFSKYGFDNVIRVIKSWRLPRRYYCEKSKLITILTMNISDDRLREYLGSSSKNSYTLKSSAFEEAAQHLRTKYPEDGARFLDAPKIEIYLIKYGEEIFGKMLTLAKKCGLDRFLTDAFMQCEKIFLEQSLGGLSMTEMIDAISRAADEVSKITDEVSKINYKPTLNNVIQALQFGPENIQLLYGLIDRLQHYEINFDDCRANIDLEKARKTWSALAAKTNDLFDQDLFFQVQVIEAALAFLKCRTGGITGQLMDAVIASGTGAYEAAELKLHQSLATFLKEKGLEQNAAGNDSMQLLLQKFPLILPKLLNGEEVKIRINEWVITLCRDTLGYNAIDPKKDMHFACELIIPTIKLLADRRGAASIPENKGEEDMSGVEEDMSGVEVRLRKFCQKYKIPFPENSWEKVHNLKLQIGETTTCKCKGKGSGCSDSNDEFCLNCRYLYEDIIDHGLDRTQKYRACSRRNGFPVSLELFDDYGRCLELYQDSGEDVFIGYMHLSAMLGQELSKYGAAYKFNKEMDLMEAVNRCYQLQLRECEVTWLLINCYFSHSIDSLSYSPYKLPRLQ